MTHINKFSHLSGTFLLVFFINFFFFSAHAAMNMLPDYLKNTLGASNAYIGFFMNINAVALIIFVVCFGVYSNKINKKISLLIGFSMFIISMLLMFVFSTNLIILLVIRFFSTISYAFGYTMHMNIIFDIIPKDKRSSSIALFGISGIMSNPVGSYLGEHIACSLGHRYLFIMSAVFMTIAFILVCCFHEKHNCEKDLPSISFWQVIFDKKIIPVVTTSLLFGGIYGVLVSFIPILSKERFGVSILSYFFIPSSIVAVVTRLFLSNFLDTFPRPRILQIGFSFALLSLILLLAIPSKVALFIVGFCYGAGHALMFPTFSTEFINMGSNDEKVIRSNTYIASQTIGVISITTLFGFIGDIFHTESIFLCTIVATIIAILLCFLMKKS